MIRTLLLIASLAAAAHGIQHDGFCVKYGLLEANADKEYFFNVPRTTDEVEAKGWQRTERPSDSILSELDMYCSPGRNICPIYAATGFITGLMIAFPVEDYVSPTVKAENKFVRWSAEAQGDEPAKDYWTATQWYAPQETLEAGDGPQEEEGTTLQYGGVWVTRDDGELVFIPTTEAELNNTTYKRQNCVPNMGLHYYYNMTTDLACDDLLPWPAMTLNGELVATAFQIMGNLTQNSERFDKFQNKLVKAGLKTVTPDAPECFFDAIEQSGLLSMHIYYVKDPWNITCA